MQRADLTTYLDSYLRHASIPDVSLNGLQVEGRAEVGTIALAVDASLVAIEGAIAAGADLLLTHHGLFWGRAVPLRGWLGQRIKRLMQSDVSLYTSHLPLDCHPEIGNNAELARLLGWERGAPFGEFKNVSVGFITTAPQPLGLSELLGHIASTLNIPASEIRTWGSPERPIQRIAVVSGGAASNIEEAISAGCDALLTGEPDYGATFPAIESGVPLICAGHYHTETVGIQALGAHLAARFGLRTCFIPGPTGI